MKLSLPIAVVLSSIAASVSAGSHNYLDTYADKNCDTDIGEFGLFENGSCANAQQDVYSVKTVLLATWCDAASETRAEAFRS